MKSQILLLLLLFPVYLFSQNYIPIPADSTSEWRYFHQYHFKNDVCINYDDYRVFINGDTIINGKAYKKMYKTGELGETPIGPNSNCNPPVIYSNVYTAGIRNDFGKVYLIESGDNFEQLLFDFTLGIGDTVPYFGNQYCSIISIDSVLISNRYHQRFYVDTCGTVSTNNSKFIIEGVGSSNGFFDPWHWESSTDFNCYAENHQPIFPVGASCVLNIGIEKTVKPILEICVYPNPSESIINFELNEISDQIISIQIFNIVGKEMKFTSFAENEKSLQIDILEFPSGVYFYYLKTESKGVIITDKFIKK